ncbi:MAG: hypothetical protein WAM14_14270 [Candidatus Nitrosopolaris sp.]
MGRVSGRYIPSQPRNEKRIQAHKFGPATVADAVGDTFQPRDGPQQAPPGASQYSTSPIFRPRHTADDQRYGTPSSHETKLKIEELKGLVSKYPQYHTNPDEIIKWAIYCSINGDNKFLDEKLAQLRSIDRFQRY